MLRVVCDEVFRTGIETTFATLTDVSTLPHLFGAMQTLAPLDGPLRVGSSLTARHVWLEVERTTAFTIGAIEAPRRLEVLFHIDGIDYAFRYLLAREADDRTRVSVEFEGARATLLAFAEELRIESRAWEIRRLLAEDLRRARLDAEQSAAAPVLD